MWEREREGKDKINERRKEKIESINRDDDRMSLSCNDAIWFNDNECFDKSLS